MSESTSNIICENGSTIEENSGLNVSNEVPLVEQTGNTDQNMEISDDESTITIGEISCDDDFDDITHAQQSVHEELYYVDQNEQSGSSNNVDIVNNENSGHHVENCTAIKLIARDINLAFPTIIIQVPRPILADVRGDNPHFQFDQLPIHGQINGNIITTKVCYRDTCINLVLPVKLHKPRAAAVEAAAKIAKSALKRKYSHTKKNTIKLNYSCGHREKIGYFSLKRIGINIPSIVKESRLLDDRLMRSANYILKLPAELTVHQILNDFQRKAPVNREAVALIFTTFNYALPTRLLYFIERMQYNELVTTYPNRSISELYGLTHLLRFIASLPRLYKTMKRHHTNFHIFCTRFMNMLINYLVAENLCVGIENDYKYVIPEYHRYFFGFS